MTKNWAVGLLALALLGSAGAARADCAVQLDLVRAKLRDLKEENRREEVTKLADKAEADHRNGRERLCADAIDRALALLK